MIAARTISEMFDQIKAAVADEQKTHRLRGIMGQVARTQGRQPTDSELDGAVQFVGEYINHVPLLLLVMTGAAKKFGVSETIDPLLEACEHYWKTGFDVIPDHLGLLGYMDDAYYVLSILQAIAERHRQADGKPLMSLDLGPMNQGMRNLIGEPHATILDTAVATELAAPGLAVILQKLQQFPGGFLIDRDPIYGDASIDDIVKGKMGALGIV